MKKQNGKVLDEQLKRQSSSLMIIISCIAVLMLITYVGVSFTAKGTYSASNCTGAGEVEDSSGNCVVQGTTCTTSGGSSGVIGADGTCIVSNTGGGTNTGTTGRTAPVAGCYACASSGNSGYIYREAGATIPNNCNANADSNYEYVDGACQVKSTSPKTVTLTFKRDNGLVIAYKYCTIAANAERCASDILAPEPPMTSSNGTGTFNGWGTTEGCETGTYAANATFAIFRTSYNKTYYACYKDVSNTGGNTNTDTTTETIDLDNCHFGTIGTVTRDQDYLNCKYTNITYTTYPNQTTAARAKACCESLGYTWVAENFTQSGYGYEYCVKCEGSGNYVTPKTPQVVGSDRCNIATKQIVHVASCDLSADDIAGYECTSINDTKQGECTLSNGTKVNRCSLGKVYNAACTEINEKRCYNDPNTGKGEWVTVLNCDNDGNSGNCTLEGGKVVARKNLTLTAGCDTTTTTTAPTNVVTNPKTGTMAIIIAWIAGALAIAYALYYFTQTNKKLD